MGQYHRIYNLDKKETFRIGSSKLLEQSSSLANMTGLMVLLCNSNGRGGGDLYVRAAKYNKKTFEPIYSKKEREAQASIDAISGRWAGDRIVVQGDYAKKGDPSFISEAKLEQFKDITDLVMAAVEQDSMAKAEVEFERKFKAKWEFSGKDVV